MGIFSSIDVHAVVTPLVRKHGEVYASDISGSQTQFPSQYKQHIMAPLQIPHRELYINGQWVQSKKRLPITCPFTEEQIGSIPGGGAPEVEAAVAAATKAFYNGSWSKLTGAERASYLRKIADKVRVVAIT